MNTNFKVIGLTPLGIKPKSTVPEAGALTTWPSELFKLKLVYICERGFSTLVKVKTKKGDRLQEEMPCELLSPKQSLEFSVGRQKRATESTIIDTTTVLMQHCVD